MGEEKPFRRVENIERTLIFVVADESNLKIDGWFYLH